MCAWVCRETTLEAITHSLTQVSQSENRPSEHSNEREPADKLSTFHADN